MGRILRTFLAGVIALLPIAVTLFVILWIASLVASFAGPGSFVGRLITRLGASLGLNILPSSGTAYLLGFLVIPRLHLPAQACGRNAAMALDPERA